MINFSIIMTLDNGEAVGTEQEEKLNRHRQKVIKST